MLENLRRVAREIGDFMRAQSPARLAAMGLTAIVIIVTITGLFMWAGEKNYAPLMTNLNPEDSANIIRILREKRIPFRVDESGRNISVPPESLYEFRLELASMGMPQSSVPGYELFDKQSLGTTSFVNKINQKRALEGELMRTINTIRGVKRSRVHLALPQKSTFVEDQKKSTASVVLDLEPGVQLSDKQVYGVGNLIARAVEGMDVADVVITDSNGKMLSKNTSDPLAAATASQIDIQQSKEKAMEKDIETILGRVVGEGRVQAKVSAELDFSQVSETQTIVDGDSSAVLSVERRNDQMNGVRPAPQGLGGAASNTPGLPPAANGEIRNDTTKSSEVVNNVVPQTIRKTSRPVGSIKRLSVAVVVDTHQVKTVDAAGKTESKSEAWSAEKLKEFEDIVAGAVGLDRKRGDTLEIKNLEFTHEDFEEAQRIVAEKERKSYFLNLALYGVIGMIVLLFFFFVVRPFIKWITENTIDNVDSFLPQTIEELERLHKSSAISAMDDATPMVSDKLDPEKVEGEMMREKIVSLIESNPHKAAMILHDWLHDANKKAGGEKEEEGGAKKAPATA